LNRFILPLLAAVACWASPARAQHDDVELLNRYAQTSEVSSVELTAMRRIEGHMRFLASDAMAGRDTATVTGDVTAEYVASQLLAYGVEPAGDDGTFLQHYPLVRSGLDLERLRFDMHVDGELERSFVADDEYAVRGYGAAGYDMRGGVVFAGHGLVDNASGVDDFGGLDVEGRFVLVLAGAPTIEDIDPGLVVASNWRAKQEHAKGLGALGLIIINPPDDERAAQWFRFAKARMRGQSMNLGGEERASNPFPRLYVESAVAEAMFDAAGHDFAEALDLRTDTAGLGGFTLSDVTLDLAAPVAAEELSSANTVGIIRGSDPELADEMLVLSAHMDHVGVDDSGEIYNGADDNASGTSVILMAAQALARDPSRLRRSIVILGVTGEEKGLLGSEWWVSNPTVDIDKVVGNINIDMVGRNQPDSIGVTPSPDHPEHNSLVTMAQSLTEEAGIEIEWQAGEGDYLRKVDEYYYRSDHVNFSNAGIPVIFFFAGEHEDYHKPTDTVEKIDIYKVMRVANLVTLLSRVAANSPERPVRFAK